MITNTYNKAKFEQQHSLSYPTNVEQVERPGNIRDRDNGSITDSPTVSVTQATGRTSSAAVAQHAVLTQLAVTTQPTDDSAAGSQIQPEDIGSSRGQQ